MVSASSSGVPTRIPSTHRPNTCLELSYLLTSFPPSCVWRPFVSGTYDSTSGRSTSAQHEPTKFGRRKGYLGGKCSVDPGQVASISLLYEGNKHAPYVQQEYVRTAFRKSNYGCPVDISTQNGATVRTRHQVYTWNTMIICRCFFVIILVHEDFCGAVTSGLTHMSDVG